jgi:predicted dehydrogenase
MSLKTDSRPLQAAGMTRRRFIYSTAVAAGALGISGCQTTPRRPPRVPANDKLNIACIGTGGKGRSDTDYCAGENIVALCDVDEVMAAPQQAKYPNAKFYRDWRVLLEQEKSIDAVVISTPDHLHAAIASAAIKLGKHVYCQKPLTQTMYEARYLRQLAAEHKVITQMGNQGSAAPGLRRAVEVIQAGIIGSVREVHVWSNRPVWPQGLNRPDGTDEIPVTLDWDKWLGPAPERPYKRNAYHAFNWRGWFDFGTGAMGDMACHTTNMPFRALKLESPASVELVEHSELFKETYPKTSKIKFQFPARGELPAVDFYWYDGDPKDKDVKPFRPHPDLLADIRALQEAIPDSGCLLIGDKGRIFSPDDYGTRFYVRQNDEKELTPSKEHAATNAVPETVQRNLLSPDHDAAHHLEWINACKGGPECYSPFAIGSRLTEFTLLGCIATRVGKRIEWDGLNLRSTNVPEVAQLVQREYRQGWKLA